VLQLVADGRLALTDRVSRYLPGFHVQFKGCDHDVTIEQLLHHTSGLPPRAIGKIVRLEFGQLGRIKPAQRAPA
jgi:putative ATP-binding cassette transporter